MESPVFPKASSFRCAYDLAFIIYHLSLISEQLSFITILY
ncbi:hypothetical protein HMPREF1986_01244 [Oribacterium sp. oral taxon 078 str. F0263]|nr:hypothetical protein HMPREF1986_01244 [Oribacterium sp. oral taxon 078 str. F0263]